MRPDVIMILGGGTDGTLKSTLYTEERIKAFPRIYKKYFGKPIIAVGGYSTWMKTAPKYREADVMQNYLVKRGIPEDLILIERKSRDTISNAFFSKQIVKKFPHWKNILIITTKGHEGRSKRFFQKAFGKKYRFAFVGVPSHLPSFRNNPGRTKYERYAQRLITKRFLKDLKDGDDATLGSRLKQYHPAFSRSKAAKQLAEEISGARQEYLGYTELKAKK